MSYSFLHTGLISGSLSVLEGHASWSWLWMHLWMLMVYSLVANQNGWMAFFSSPFFAGVIHSAGSSLENWKPFLFVCLLVYILFIYLFIFGSFGSLLLLVGFLYLWRAGATLCWGAQASHCGGFLVAERGLLGVRASVVVACGLSSCGSRALERMLSSCGIWA